jgi:GTPase SAR1 family protein
VFIICFSINIPASYENIKKKWLPEIKQHAESAPIILVGTKSDLRNDPDTINTLKKKGQAPITSEQGSALQRDIGAAKYMECSAKRNENVKEIFNEAIRAHLFGVQQAPKKTSVCSML